MKSCKMLHFVFKLFQFMYSLYCLIAVSDVSAYNHYNTLKRLIGALRYILILECKNAFYHYYFLNWTQNLLQDMFSLHLGNWNHWWKSSSNKRLVFNTFNSKHLASFQKQKIPKPIQWLQSMKKNELPTYFVKLI